MADEAKAKAPIKMTHAEWEAKGIELFGQNRADWKFVCPSCGHVASVSDYVKADARDMVAFSCIGRALGATKQIGEKPGPCNYAGGGLFQLNPIHIEFPDGTVQQYFAFAEEKTDGDAS